MTFKKMLERDYPRAQVERLMLDLCPEDLRYEEKSPCADFDAKGGPESETCRKCWEREAAP